MKQKRAGKKSNRCMIGVMILALFSICAGILIMGYELNYRSKELEFVVLEILGVIYLLMGIGGIRLEKSKQMNFLRNVASKNEKKLVLLLSYSLWFLSAVWAVYAVFMGNGNLGLALILSVMSVIMLFCACYSPSGLCWLEKTEYINLQLLE